jgi:hypothetical protein
LEAIVRTFGPASCLLLMFICFGLESRFRAAGPTLDQCSGSTEPIHSGYTDLFRFGRAVQHHKTGMDALKTRVLEVRDIMEAELSPELFVIATHQLVHIPDQMRDEGPVPDLWMFAPESFFGELRRIIRTRSHPVASMMKGVELKRMVSLVRGLYQLLQANGSPPTISQPRSENTVSLMLATGNERKGKLVYSTPGTVQT